MMAADCLEALGIKRGDYVIKVNNRKVLDGVMEAIGLGGAENAGRRLTVLRAIDKLDRLGPEGVRALLARGARTRAAISRRGRGLRRADDIDRVCILAFSVGGHVGRPLRDDRIRSRCRRRIRLRRELRCIVSSNASNWADRPEGVEELREIAELVDAAGYGADRIRHRPLRRPRPRILHRPRLRGGADLRSARTRPASRSASARSAAAGATTALSRASAPSRSRRPASRSASRGSWRRCARSKARSWRRRRRRGRSSCWRSTATRSRWPTTSASSRACARPGSRPNFISAPAA